MIDNACEWGATTLLIFSQNVGTLVYYTHIFPLLISLFLGVYVFINNPRRLVNRVLFFVTLMFSLWVYFDLILWASPTPEAVMFFWSLIVPVEMFIYLGSLYLVYLFSTDQHDVPIYIKAAVALFALPLLLFSHTNLNVMGLAPDCDTGAIEGPLISYMYMAELIVIGLILTILSVRYKKITNQANRNRFLLIGIATVLFLLFFSAGNLTLLFSLGPYYEQYKLFGMPIFATIVTYTIVRYRAFSIETVVTEILIAALWMLLFSMMLFEKMNNARPIIAVTLIFFGVLGLQLARSVRNEVAQRQEIERLVYKLERANKRLTVLDKMKSEFVSIASHQLRSPLAAIRGYASMMLEGSYGNFPEKSRFALERIADSSKYMAESIEDYLNVSRIESGNMKYDLTDFNFKDACSVVVDELRPIALKKGLLLSFRSDTDSSCIVHADMGKTRQALYNLINNSIKYTQKGSILVTVQDDPRRGLIRTIITDTGIGMSQETIATLFSKFSRAKDANQVDTTGTGLGLYVARQMIKHMGGDIVAMSDGEKRGSTFTLTLPLEQ